MKTEMNRKNFNDLPAEYMRSNESLVMPTISYFIWIKKELLFISH